MENNSIMGIEELFLSIENLVCGVGVFELNNKKITPLYLNEGIFRMLGYSRIEGMRYFANIEANIIEADKDTFYQGITDILKDDGPVEVEFRTVTGNGGIRWNQVRGNLYSRNGDSYVIVVVILDSSERKGIEEELKLQADRLHILSESEGERIFDYNAKTDVMTIKASYEEGSLKDHIVKDYIQKFDSSEIFPDDAAYYKAVFEDALKTPKRDSIEFRTMQFDGDYQWYRENITSMADKEGYVTRVVGRLCNIHEKKLKELELEIKAEKDGLTGLYNKAATRQLIQNILDKDTNPDEISALMIIDLDNFKAVNDNLGHATGDEVLASSAEKMMTVFKGSDIVGRIGGDEFVVFMKGIKAISNTDIAAKKLNSLIDTHLSYNNEDIRVTCSIGIAIYPYHGRDYDELFLKADKALYTAKANGKNGHRVFDAATTIAYHGTRRNNTYHSMDMDDDKRSLEDLVMQILFEDKDKENAVKSILEIMSVEYKLQRAYAFMVNESDQQKSVELCFASSGHEFALEPIERKTLREDVSRQLFAEGADLTIVKSTASNHAIVKRYMEETGVQSMIYYPMTAGDNFKGAIIFENYQSSNIVLSSEQNEELRCLFRIINAYILQIGLMEHPQDTVTQIEMLDDFDSYVYVIDYDTYELEFVNKKVVMDTPKVKIGDLCYKSLRYKDSPCEDCPMKKMDPQKLHQRHSEEIFNASLRAWTKCLVSWFDYKEGNRTCLMNCIDISEYFLPEMKDNK